MAGINGYGAFNYYNQNYLRQANKNAKQADLTEAEAKNLNNTKQVDGFVNDNNVEQNQVKRSANGREGGSGSTGDGGYPPSPNGGAIPSGNDNSNNSNNDGGGQTAAENFFRELDEIHKNWKRSVGGSQPLLHKNIGNSKMFFQVNQDYYPSFDVPGNTETGYSASFGFNF